MVDGKDKKPKGRRGKKGRSSTNNNAGAAGAAAGGGGGPSFPVVSDSRFSSMHSAPVSWGYPLLDERRCDSRRVSRNASSRPTMC